MRPHSHERVIRLAVARLGDPRWAAAMAALLDGNRDEDSYRWPLVGWRTQAIGFTHTHRPGGRFGQLLFPSAQRRLVHLCARARAGSAVLVGRACHLLTDAAVPARARGVWHYLGDPLECWLDRHLDEVSALSAVPVPDERDPAALIDRLARIAAAQPADRTRTALGQVARQLGLAAPLDESTLAAQGRALFPVAVAHVAALLAGLGVDAPAR
jgi:hypothetical protein